ncbi:MAG: SprB repeat-containing protein, partial [Putridiphycobacter sp.]|nr:SprB repeat-containing protein [Putridiphycobacter sp.]
MSVKSILLFLVVFLSTSLVAKDLYWIGQSGDWNNPKNWSLQSGGSPANIIPGEQDNVYFDSKSFDNKFSAVNFGEVSVRSLHIDSDKIPTLLGTRIILSSKIEIKQNVALNSNIEFKSEDNNTGIINTGGFQINANVFIVKGEWELHNHLILSDKNKLVIENSTLLTKENSIQCGDFIASKGAELNLEASTIYPMFKLDLANAKKKGGSFILIDNGFERRDLGRYTGSVVTKGASTCGSLNLTTVISSNYNGQSISCAGACDGELTVTASGTPGPYSYQLLYFGFVGAITSATVYPNLCPATYTIKVVDSSNVIGPGIYASCTVDEPINEP